MKLLSAVLTLFLIMDPIGNVLVFAPYLKDVPEHRRTWVVARESLFALLVLLFFLFCGPFLMELLHISRESLHITGGVLLFVIALGMIFPGPAHFGVYSNEQIEGEPFFVPLAVPLIAGPSTMATIMILASQKESIWLWLGALLTAWGVSAAILLSSARIARLLGPRGLRACERLMGMVLTVVAVQMFLDGVRHFLASRPWGI